MPRGEILLGWLCKVHGLSDMGEQSDQGGERKRAIVSENVMTATMQTLTPMSAEHVPVDITRMSLMQQHVFR